MTSTPRGWAAAGLLSGLCGLATSIAVAALLGRDAPVVNVAQLVVRLAPGGFAEGAIRVLRHYDKPALVVGILLVTCALFLLAGRLARRHPWLSQGVWLTLALIALAAALLRRGASTLDLVPVLVGYGTWVWGLAWITWPLSPVARDVATPGETRRGFLLRAGVVVLGSVGVAALARRVSAGRRHVEDARALLRLDSVTQPEVPARASLDIDGLTPWQTPAEEFYVVDTALQPPAILPTDWSLRIHGLVGQELVVTYQDLIDRAPTEAWITLNCVSNPIGGDLIGNAWWSGVRIAELLDLCDVDAEADCVLQTSQDGWTCTTPLAALRDDRNALLAVAMNGESLPINHGFPVRTVVPGLYGYVSACKWVVDFKVTRFEEVSAFWTDKGWAEQAPVKMSSRIDRPRSGDSVPAGPTWIGGVAWAQHTGIRGVEVSLDGGAWTPAEVARVKTVDTWVQWAVQLPVEAGDHQVRVRATDNLGAVQTGVRRDVLPDGATGWHTVDFSAE